jgi:hypothetical protein
MPRKSAEQLAADRFRLPAELPKAPRDFTRSAAHLWRALIKTKMPEHWSEEARLALRERVLAEVQLRQVQAALVDDPLNDKLTRMRVALAGSINVLTRRLRMGPAQEIKPWDVAKHRPAIMDDPLIAPNVKGNGGDAFSRLIGGPAVHSAPPR